jgi:predicted metalloprotease with PDZ domain
MRLRCLALAQILALAGICGAAEYSIEVEGKALRVRVVLKSGSSDEFRMPAWSPGDYRIVNFGKGIRDVHFYRAGRAVEAVQGDDPNQWRISGEADSVAYTVPATGPGIFSENLRITPNELFMHGPAALGYFVGHTSEEQELSVKPYPSQDTAIQTSLDSLSGRAWSFRANDYDSLVDAPLVMGSELRVRSFTIYGKEHRVVAFGKAAGVEMEGFVKLGLALAEQAKRVFGELPYKRYLFLLDFGGPGGGLEHADSARLAMWPGSTAESAAGFLAHEYFHCFNVKRIRSKPLGPFDYAKPAVTGALWWLEGVTDYYAEVFTFRAGYQSREEFFAGLSEEARGLLRRPARLKVSADESSRRVWEANNSTGYGGLDYYQKGKLIGLCLDIAIRTGSKGARSLDDVMAALFRECKAGSPGFEEGRIRELCIQFGGDELGPLYDRCVMKAEELPLAEMLPLIGMQWNGGITDDPGAGDRARALRAAYPSR